MPYKVTLPDKEGFPIYEHEDSGYKVRFLPPARSAGAGPGASPSHLTIDGKPAFEADVLCIEFYKESFARGMNDPIDPPEVVIRRAVSSFHARLRYVTRAAHAKPVSFPWNAWRMEYVNDDGTPLEKKDGFFRARGARQFEWSFIGINTDVWEKIHAISSDFEVPVWDGLRLDALDALPSVGTAVVLAATSLEVFISSILDKLVERGACASDLWLWIKERGEKGGNWLRQPTVEEQFDALLKHFCGHSLKNEPDLWEAFKNLKTARNTFVHDGIAKIGNKPITKENAVQLIARVNDIIQKVREWIPEDLRWPECNPKVEISWTQVLFEAPGQASQSTPEAGPTDHQH